MPAGRLPQPISVVCRCCNSSHLDALQYLAANGWEAFFKWYDYKVWYPLGRPVGTTIYPGMQISSVAIWKVPNASLWPRSCAHVALGRAARLPALGMLLTCFGRQVLGYINGMSLNDVCCLVPAWFGVSASFLLAMLALECSGSYTNGAFAAS